MSVGTYCSHGLATSYCELAVSYHYTQNLSSCINPFSSIIDHGNSLSRTIPAPTWRSLDRTSRLSWGVWNGTFRPHVAASNPTHTARSCTFDRRGSPIACISLVFRLNRTITGSKAVSYQTRTVSYHLYSSMYSDILSVYSLDTTIFLGYNCIQDVFRIYRGSHLHI